jgi:3-hydroxymyristoyl/3-hydroxydecanoyl-(acyl carrier protein) dehydratase
MTAEEETRHTAVFKVAPSHPAIPGHFPGHPVVPGVVILQEVILAMEHWLGRPLRVSALPNVKFLSPLLPGVQATVELTRRGSTISFSVRCGEATIAKGVLTADAASNP